MKSRTGGLRSGLLVLFTALSLILAVAGNLLGNVVAERVPDDWKSRAPTLLALTILLYLIVNISLARLQDTLADNWRKALNRRLRIVGLLLLVLDALLAALGGLLSNLAADRLLPQQFAVFAPLLYAGVVLLALAISFVIYWLQGLSRSQETKRTYLLERLRDRYETLRNGALQGEPSIGVRIAWEAQPPTSANASIEPTTEGSLSAALPFFDAGDGHLLLLGQPGAGKSVLLAELGLDLIRRVRNDSKQPIIPVIFPLSTWAINRKSLAEWLVESLQGPPNRISEKQARSWVDSGTILPLLDGLDEVGDVAARDACVQVINAFYAAHPQAALVVTSRIEEYREQKVSLTLTEATIEPLSDKQIVAYLEQAGAAYDALREAVEQNADLREALKTLLFLRVVMRTYGDTDPSQLPPVGDQNAWIQQLFRDYVAQMLKRRRYDTDNVSYMPDKVTSYLSWLAEEMQVHKLPDFYFKQVGLDWIPGERSSSNHLRKYRSVSLVAGLLFAGPSGGLVWILMGLVGIMHHGFEGGALIFLIGGTVGWVVSGLTFILFFFVERLSDIAEDIADSDFDDLFSGFLEGMAYILADMSIDLSSDIQVESKPISQVESEPTRRARRIRLLETFPMDGYNSKLICWLAILVCGNTVASALILGLLNHSISGLLDGLLLGLLLIAFGVGVWILRLIIEVFSFWLPTLLDVWTPGLLAVALLGALTCGWLFVPVHDSSPVLHGLLYGIALTVLSIWLASGVEIYRVAVFLILWRRLRKLNVIPPHYAQFLDYSVSHILLQKVGHGYRFIHPLLRDYFANLRAGVNVTDSTG